MITEPDAAGSRSDLLAEIAGVLVDASAAAPSTEARAILDDARRRLDEPLRVAVAGRVKAGKSTLLNALIGEELAPTDTRECTSIVTWYRNAHTYRVLLHPKDGEPQQRPFTRPDGVLDVDLGGMSAADVDHLEVWCPSARLEAVTLIDTPGIGSIAEDVSSRTYEFLADEGARPTAADAAIYLLRHLHVTDARFLDAFHDDGLSKGTSINTIGVLSRADEIGACRPGAMDAAARVAARYQTSSRVRRLCRVVVPVAGLLAQAGATLREEEFRALAQLSQIPRQQLLDLLLTTDRFAGSEAREATVPVTVRAVLLRRLGLYGVRLSADLIRTRRADSAGALATELVAASGIEDLRAALLTQLAGRSRVLKARSALATLEAVLRQKGWEGAEGLRERVERISSGAHEIAEIRILNALQAGDVGLPATDVEDLERVLGGRGATWDVRLELAEGASGSEVREVALDQLGRWRRVVEHPLSSSQVRAAAAGAVRSLEGILAQLPAVR